MYLIRYERGFSFEGFGFGLEFLILRGNCYFAVIAVIENRNGNERPE